MNTPSGKIVGDSQVAQWRADFPILTRRVRGKRLAYLDNGATTQKPASVIEAVANYYRHSNANVHRGVHLLSEEATDGYEGARQTVCDFIGAAGRDEIIFTKGTTDAINLVAAVLAEARLGAGDEVLITHLEHHSNIVPWQLACKRSGAQLKVAPINDRGEVDLDAYGDLLSERTRIVSMAHVSNALGTINPVADMVRLARDAGALTLVDGAQAVAHGGVDVRALGCDFYAFSGHKLFAPTGIGILYGRRELLETLPPYQGGGDMIRTVSFSHTEYNDLPYRYEAGTPNIAGAIGLGAAITYLQGIGMAAIQAHEAALLRYATQRMEQVAQVRILGTAAQKAAILSFVLGDVHAHDLGTILDAEGVAIRAGHHCAMPVMEFFKVPATARMSLAFYNDREDIDQFFGALETARKLFL